jgi:hypothetical protein
MRANIPTILACVPAAVLLVVWLFALIIPEGKACAAQHGVFVRGLSLSGYVCAGKP